MISWQCFFCFMNEKKELLREDIEDTRNNQDYISSLFRAQSRDIFIISTADLASSTHTSDCVLNLKINMLRSLQIDFCSMIQIRNIALSSSLRCAAHLYYTRTAYFRTARWDTGQPYSPSLANSTAKCRLNLSLLAPSPAAKCPQRIAIPSIISHYEEKINVINAIQNQRCQK